jgi:preprotein translocase subunit YajC
VEVAVVYFVILAGAFFFLIVRPQRRRSLAHRTFVGSVEVGDHVITNGGIYGEIVGVGEDRVELLIAAGVVVTVAKVALATPAYAPMEAEDGSEGDEAKGGSEALDAGEAEPDAGPGVGSGA